MTKNPKFELRLDQPFNDGKPLPNAPVHEAVIHWRARSETQLAPDALIAELKQRLPDYPTSMPQHEVEMQFTASPAGTSQSHTANWRGFRFESADKLHVAQFNRNGFAFSQLQQYSDWSKFTSEAFRLWHIFVELAKPIEVERLGIRFINVIEIGSMKELPQWLKQYPKGPADFDVPVQQFMHQTNFRVPDHPYQVNVVQMVPPPESSSGDSTRLILDIDVATDGVPIEADETIMNQRLDDMRWIKNKAFQAYVTDTAIDSFK